MSRYFKQWFFNVIGEAGRENARIEEQWVIELLQSLEPGKRLLDAGGGQLKYKSYCGHLHYVSQDFCQYDGSGDSHGLQTGNWDTRKVDIVSDITEIPEPDNSFDYILCTQVLEHLPDPRAAIKEFSRLLVPGGTLILTAPFCSMTHFAPYHYCTGFNKYWYETIMPIFHLTPVSIVPYGDYFCWIAQELYRLRSVIPKYTRCKLNFIELFSLTCLIKLLNNCHKWNNGSEELLCYGYCVVGKKSSI